MIFKDRNLNQRAFTLVELLVVISIIALLIAILLPSLQKAREQSKTVVCKANLRSVGQAFSMYADKYGGVWPAAVDSMNQQNRWPRMFFDANVIHQGFNVYDTNGSLKKGRNGDSIFLCPAEKADRAVQDWNVPPNPNGTTVDRAEIGGSYAYSEEHQRPSAGEAIDRGNLTRPAKLTLIDRCRRPSEVVTLLDNYRPIDDVHFFGWRFNRDNFFQGFRTPAGVELPNDPRYESYKILGTRHDGKANMLMLDTHVEMKAPDKIRYDQISWERWSKVRVMDDDSLNDNDEEPPGGI